MCYYSQLAAAAGQSRPNLRGRVTNANQGFRHIVSIRTRKYMNIRLIDFMHPSVSSEVSIPPPTGTYFIRQRNPSADYNRHCVPSSSAIPGDLRARRSY